MEVRYLIGLLITIAFILFAKYWSESKNLIVGDKAPDFSYTDMIGKSHSLSDYSGKYTLIDFWGSWCQPCRKSNGKLVKLINQVDTSQIQIISIGIEENQDQWKEAIRKDSLFWPQHTSSFEMFQADLAKEYHVHETPTYFLLDRDRKIIARSGALQEISEILSRKDLLN
ncbi:TlpA family protein disulfide reductase [Membranihabitans maritimus]|uniref:TlpA family protein disulfide reductase n=1 Tax=Membranihabitans maritimus TaxID=2904244 RepID=UPI001F279AF5|nr:TlpA disulfide reductase family protein [Membranihabitans maritimus]